MDHFETLRGLIEIEHKAELEQNKLELSRFPVAVRESLGKSVTRLSCELTEEEVPGGIPVLALSRPPAGEDLSPFHAMNRGDLVAVETPTGQRLDGTLYDVDEYHVLVAMNGALPDPLPKGRWSLHLVGSDATYKRMRQALEDVRLAEKKPVARLRDVFSGRLKPGVDKAPKFNFRNQSLNEWQQEAVKKALAAEDVSIVHGPPGTGKTTVLVETIWQTVQAGGRVLATAPSNIAVDNILEKLLDSGLRVVRLGHPARTLKSLQHATLSAQVADHPDKRKVRDLDQARERLMVQRSRRRDRVQLGWDELQERQKEIQSLWREAREMEKAISKEIVNNAQVLLATHGGISRTLGAKPFDLVVMDEASQATEPLSWIPLLQAKKAVFAGDPLQLPPTLYSEEAAKAGLAYTLFERLQKTLPHGLQTLLRVQYRMHEAIMKFPSDRFYGGKLIADASVAKHRIDELPHVKKGPLTGAPLAYVDTAGAGFEEGWDEGLQSRDNEGEAKLAGTLLRELLHAGVRAKDIAVITPYVAQVRRLKSLLSDTDVEIGTVDGFQGREKEAVIVSLVRSNDKGEVGFLQDTRRMNVALTRARRLLLVLGDSATITRHPLYAAFSDYAESLDSHRSAWEWL